MTPSRRLPGSRSLLLLVVALAISWGLACATTSARSVPHVARTHAASALPVIAPRVSCSSLVQPTYTQTPGVPDFEDIPGAPARIESATALAATATTPAYCDVKGYILDQIEFELKLPTSTYQGRYLQEGCGGFCGMVSQTSFPACDADLGGDFAIAATDDGHEASQTDAVWAGHDPNLRRDFGYRAVHDTAVVSKAIIAAYYGSAPRQSYFAGCSDGGREGLMEAERYPHDFNGILAGAPANLMSTDPLWLAYMIQSNTDAQGNPILTADKLVPLHNAVMQACGDGLGDNLIAGDPYDCHFNPASIECQGSDGPDCLTAAQVTVVDKIYRGVVVNGMRLDPRKVPYGSELSWAGWWVPAAAGQIPVAQAFGENAARWLSFPIGKGVPLSQVTFTPQEFHLLAKSAKDYESYDPDLRAFRAHGGKLIMYGGWDDTLVPPSQTLEYWQAVTHEMGGRKATSQFARLFMVPGMGHCGAFGPTPDSSALVEQLVDWVEQGQAPRSILASESSGGAQNQALSEPVYPYPKVAKYVGPSISSDPTGPNVPSNYAPAKPAVRHSGFIKWIGDYYFKPRPPSSFRQH